MIPAKILKGMTDYLAARRSLSAKFDSDIEVITPELQKIQFTSSGQMKMNRPDKLRVRRTGGYADVELVFDGKTRFDLRQQCQILRAGRRWPAPSTR